MGITRAAPPPLAAAGRGGPLPLPVVPPAKHPAPAGGRGGRYPSREARPRKALGPPVGRRPRLGGAGQPEPPAPAAARPREG